MKTIEIMVAEARAAFDKLETLKAAFAKQVVIDSKYALTWMSEDLAEATIAWELLSWMAEAGNHPIELVLSTLDLKLTSLKDDMLRAEPSKCTCPWTRAYDASAFRARRWVLSTLNSLHSMLIKEVSNA